MLSTTSRFTSLSDLVSLAKLSPMRKVNVHEAKTNLSSLLEEVDDGNRIIIARAGEPVAVLVPYRLAVRPRKLGLFAGEARIHDDFDRLPADLAATLGAEP